MLWRKVRQGLSAGRVQSVATRLVVERERERMAFRSASYWDIEAHLRHARRRPLAAFDARLVAVDGAPGRDRPRLRQRRRAGRAGSTAVQLDEPTARRLATALREAAVRRPLGRGQALHAPAGRAVHDLDAAAGGQPQAADLARRPRCAWRSGCTRTATSPTCVPTRRRCRSGAERRPHARPAQLYGPEYVPDVPRRYERKVKNAQEAHEAIRPGRRLVPHARRGGRRAQPRRVRALRADLEAHRRLADGRRARADRDGPARRDGAPTGADAEFSHPAPSSPSAASWPPTRRAATRTTSASARRRARAPPAAAAPGDALDVRRAGAGRATRPRRRRATPRRPWSRRWRSAASAALDVRLDHRARSSTAATCSRRARRSCRPGWRSPSSRCWRSTSASLVDYDFTAEMEEDLDRIADGEQHRVDVAAPASTSATAGRGTGGAARAGAGRGPRRDRRPRGQLDPDRRRHRAAGRPLRPVRRARATAKTQRARCPRTSRPTS